MRRRGGPRSASRSSESRKTLSIPDEVPIGAVIGAGGSYTHAFKDKLNVHCQVDVDQRKVIVSGVRGAVLNAESELLRMFNSFSLESLRVFEVVLKDGPTSLWRFEKYAGKLVTSENVLEYRFRLARVGPSNKLSLLDKESWVQPFHRFNIDGILSYVDHENESYANRPRTEVAIGNLCFKPKGLKANTTFAWEDLQKLQPNVDHLSRWSNMCEVRSTPGVKQLVSELEKVAMKNGNEWVDGMAILVTDSSLHRTWKIKYVLADGVWKLRSHILEKTTLGSFDILQTGKPSLRARSVVRMKGSDQANDGVLRYLSIRKPAEGNFWSTTVELISNAPSEIKIDEVRVHSKARIE